MTCSNLIHDTWLLDTVKSPLYLRRCHIYTYIYIYIYFFLICCDVSVIHNIYIYMYIFIYTYICVYVYICMYIYTCMYIYISMCYMFIFIYVYMYGAYFVTFLSSSRWKVQGGSGRRCGGRSHSHAASGSWDSSAELHKILGPRLTQLHYSLFILHLWDVSVKSRNHHSCIY